MWKPSTRAVIAPWALLAALAGAALLYLRFAPPTPPTYVSVPGPTQYVPKVVTRTVSVPGPTRINLVPVDIVREKMKWPDLQDNTITATGVVPPHRGPTNVAAVASVDNAGTMTTQLVMKQLPPPFWELKRQARIGGYYGNGGALRAEATIMPFRVGPVDLVGSGSASHVDGRSDFRAWIGAEIQFGF